MSTKSTKIRASLAVTALLGVAAVGTMSLLSDTSQTEINITSATFSLVVNENASASTFEVDIDATNLAPGDTKTGDITLENTSSIPATVSLTQSALSEFTATVVDDADVAFTTVVLAPGATEALTLSVGLPEETTTSPADETLTLTFTAEQ